MKPLAALLLGAAVLVLALASPSGVLYGGSPQASTSEEVAERQAGPPPSAVVTARGFRFVPAQVAVPVDAPVLWRNDDGIAHTVVSGLPGVPDGSFRLDLGYRGALRTHAFDRPGSYPYFCDLHPRMIGVLVIE
jgi:plastocyanin